MSEKEFNLLQEPWIKVMEFDGRTEEVSLLKVFENAHRWQGLAGELLTQDIAVMRLLLAVLHTVFSRADSEGNLASLASPEEALERWKALWDRGAFPMEIIEKYLVHFEDRFWLFHEKYPFYQVPGMGRTTQYTASKLNGELSESNNKIRLFSQRTGNNKTALSYSEAARWLLYINAYDDTAAKPTKSGLPSPGAGWLGKLGLVAAVGTNLFETLLLNLVLLKDGGNELWGDGRPVWEMKNVKAAERTEISIPANPAALYTLQSRRLMLKRQQQAVVGYDLLGGDFFPKENTLNEQMTLWRNAAKKETDPPEYHPRRHDPARQLWRDFPAMVGQDTAGRKPGIVGWLGRLKAENLVSRSHFQFQIASTKYGDKDFFIDDIFGDAISFNAILLTEVGEDWVSRIINEINVADDLAKQAGQLAQNLARASGNTEKSGRKDTAKEQAYFRLDEPFRRWLESIDPHRDADRKEEVCDRWWRQAQCIVRNLGKELVYQSGPKAFIGRVVQENKQSARRYTAPEAYNRFLYRTSNREALYGKER